jgi:hypothetical protein
MIATHVAAVNAQPWREGENAQYATNLEFQVAEFQAALPAPAA